MLLWSLSTIFSGYVLFNLSLFIFHVISVNVDFVIFCKQCIIIKNLKSLSTSVLQKLQRSLCIKPISAKQEFVNKMSFSI